MLAKSFDDCPFYFCKVLKRKRSSFAYTLVFLSIKIFIFQFIHIAYYTTKIKITS